MNADKLNLEKGYDNPIKYDWLVGEIELGILKYWKPNHLASKNTIIRIETDNETIPASAIKTIEKKRIIKSSIQKK